MTEENRSISFFLKDKWEQSVKNSSFSLLDNIMHGSQSSNEEIKEKVKNIVTDIITEVGISEGYRRAKVATIKAQVQNGTYDFSSKRVAEALIKKLL